MIVGRFSHRKHGGEIGDSILLSPRCKPLLRLLRLSVF